MSLMSVCITVLCASAGRRDKCVLYRSGELKYVFILSCLLQFGDRNNRAMQREEVVVNEASDDK